MWWIFNAAGEPCFAVKNEEEAKKLINNWYTHYMYIDNWGWNQ